MCDWQNSLVPLEKVEADIPICKETIVSYTEITQYPHSLSWLCTMYEEKGLSLDKFFVDFDMQKQKSFDTHRLYTGFSTVKNYQKLWAFCQRKYNLAAVKVSWEDVLEKFEQLSQNSIFETIQGANAHSITLTTLLLNFRSLLKHSDDIVNDCRFMHNALLFFTETQISLK